MQEGQNPAQTCFLHTDMLGSIRAVTDSAGQVVARFDYEPFGLLIEESSPASAGGERYTGKPLDAELGLYYFGARYYDPGLGRFITADPARDGLNWYVYCDNNPGARVDPDGHQSQTATWAGSMSWLILADGPLPFGDIAYAGSTACVALAEYGPMLADRVIVVSSRLWDVARDIASSARDKVGGRSGSAGDPNLGPRFRSFTRSNFRDNLKMLTGEDPGKKMQAHHLLPEKFAPQFRNLGLNIHDPQYGTWWETLSHQQNSRAYNLEWARFLKDAPTADEALAFARQLAQMYGLEIHF